MGVYVGCDASVVCYRSDSFRLQDYGVDNIYTRLCSAEYSGSGSAGLGAIIIPLRHRRFNIRDKKGLK